MVHQSLLTLESITFSHFSSLPLQDLLILCINTLFAFPQFFYADQITYLLYVPVCECLSSVFRTCLLHTHTLHSHFGFHSIFGSHKHIHNINLSIGKSLSFDHSIELAFCSCMQLFGTLSPCCNNNTHSRSKNHKFLSLLHSGFISITKNGRLLPLFHLLVTKLC